MPIHEYQCPRCKIIIEKLITSSDSNKPVCPKCEGRTKKIMSASHFKGSGDGWNGDDK